MWQQIWERFRPYNYAFILKIKTGDLPSLSPMGQAENGEATSLVGKGQPWGKA